MKAVFVALFLLFAVVSADKCHPMCKWQCDDPACPAVCHPVCARPKCEMKCEEVTCAKCTIHCERPVCTIRCPKETCEKDGCPQCETVCQPARCHTTCVAPQPKCAPVCEQLDCQHKCAKPVNCAKPKCELQCEKSACEATSTPQCCPCSGSNVAVAMTQASSNCACTSSPCSCNGSLPSLLEVMHTMMHKEKSGEGEQCCPCSSA